MGGQVSRRADALVSRFQFVADNSVTFEVKRLCELVEATRSSFYAWLQAPQHGRSAPGPMPSSRIGSEPSMPKTTPRVRHGSLPSSTTAHLLVSR